MEHTPVGRHHKEFKILRPLGARLCSLVHPRQMHPGRLVNVASPSGAVEMRYVLKVYFNSANKADPMIVTGTAPDASETKGPPLIFECDTDYSWGCASRTYYDHWAYKVALCS